MNKFRISILFSLTLIAVSCQTSSQEEKKESQPPKKEVKEIKSAVEIYYDQNKGNDSASISKGSYGNGSLINGKLIPFSGKNFAYFSETSYLSERAFVNDKVLKTLLDTYKELEDLYPGKMFYVMETSHKNGGKFFPHLSHQNGLSVDLMSPMLKDGKEYTGLDSLGIPHYWIDFDENGFYKNDKSVSMNFDLIAHHVLLLEKHASENGLRINRVHFKLDLHDDLLRTDHGKELKRKGIVLTKGLTKKVSEQHDDHFHVDFSAL